MCRRDEVGPSTKASPRRGGEDCKVTSGTLADPPQRRPPHEGEARPVPAHKRPPNLALNEGEASRTSPSAPSGQPTPSTKASPRRGGEPETPSMKRSDSTLNEGLPTKGRRAQRRVESPGARVPSTKASPRRGGEERVLRGRQEDVPPSTKASPRRGGEFVGSPVKPIRSVPQRRPPHEGEASGGGTRTRPADRPSTKASPRRGGEHGPEGVRVRRGPSTKASPRRGGEPTPASSRTTSASTLNEGLPTKGRRGLGNIRLLDERLPSTKASPRRGGEALHATLTTTVHDDPQRRPPHEGEASHASRLAGQHACTPQRRPPHEGEARRLPGLRRIEHHPSTKASPRRGGELPGWCAAHRRPAPSTKASPRRGGERYSSVVSPAVPGSLNEGLPTKGRRGTARTARPGTTTTLNEGLPTKGRRGGAWGCEVAGWGPSTKASPRRGGECRTNTLEVFSCSALNEGLPTKGRRAA
ncbi:Uncharacterised protein [Rothia kristinae]|nr:Uncharacterised protein [Rothia kristinae]